MQNERASLAQQGMRSTLVGIGINIALALIKGTAGVLGNSYALIADAVESTLDVVSSLIVWTGLKISVRPPDENHPYGHGKAEPLAAVAVSLALFAAAVFIAIESVKEIRTPHHAPAAFTLVVLVLVILVKETLFRYVFQVGDATSSTAVKSDAWHHRSDAITSAAAFIGISIALIGGEGYESADDWAALFASWIIGFNAFNLLRPALAELTDAAPDPKLAKQVRTVAQSIEGVIGTHKCHVRKMGFDYYVDLDIIVDGSTTVRHAHQIAHTVQDAIRQANPLFSKVLIHVEPPATPTTGETS
ncbi:MAG: cation transporter [Caldilineaceae bacterium]|nr:cation transporter [Caldilineaceae bacterium]